MAKTTKLNYKNIGDVVFACSRRSKRIAISVGPYKPVRVSFPPMVSFGSAQQYFEKNMEWVLNKVTQAKKHEQQSDMLYAAQPPADTNRLAKGLYSRINELASDFGYTFNRVTIRSQKTRWGSCSTKNNINLNIHLSRLPQHLCDYVLLHELVHTKVKNHSKDFWKELDKSTNSKAKQLDKELGKYPIPRGKNLQ